MTARAVLVENRGDVFGEGRDTGVGAGGKDCRDRESIHVRNSPKQHSSSPCGAANLGGEPAFQPANDFLGKLTDQPSSRSDDRLAGMLPAHNQAVLYDG